MLLLAVEPAELEHARAYAEAVGGVEHDTAADPWLADDLAGGFLVDGGYTLDAMGATVAAAERARRAGVEIRLGCEAKSVITSRGRVTGLATDDGVAGAGRVVVATGPRARFLIRTAGVDLPISSSRGWLLETGPVKNEPPYAVEQAAWPVQEEMGRFSVDRSLGEIAAGEVHEPALVSVLLGARPAGHLLIGTSLGRSLLEEPEGPESVRALCERAGVSRRTSGTCPSSPPGRDGADDAGRAPCGRARSRSRGARGRLGLLLDRDGDDPRRLPPPRRGRGGGLRSGAVRVIRELRPDEMDAVAELWGALLPEEPPTTPAGFAHWIASNPPRAHFRAWVAEADGELVAGALSLLMWSVSPGNKAWVWAGVRESRRRRGLGPELYELGEQHAVGAGARAFETMALEGSPGQAFAEARGYRQTRKEIVLAPRPVRGRPGGARTSRGGEAGGCFRVVSLRDARGDETGLHAVYAAAATDIPADDPEDDVRLADFRDHILGDPELDLDASAVVVEGDRPVALSFLLLDRERGTGQSEMTGTLAGHRRRGLARLAKLASIQRAREAGIRWLSTENDGEKPRCWA